MADFQLDYIYQMETPTHVKYGVEHELVITVEYFPAADYFELTQIEEDGVVITHRDIAKGNVSASQSEQWSRIEHELINDDDLRAKAFDKHAANQFEAA